MTQGVPKNDTLIFLPTYNERKNIEVLLDALLALPRQCDILVVDDNSVDGTGEYLARRAATDERITLITRPGKLGIGSAHKTGWSYARRAGYARIVTLDADLSHDPSDVPRLLAALDAGADVALASRFAPGARIDYRGWRLFLSTSANRLAQLLLRMPLTEYTTSLRAARLDRVPAGLIETIDDDGYSFFLMAAASFVRHGLVVTEIPIHFHCRAAGESKIPKLQIFRGAYTLLCLAWKLRVASRNTDTETIGLREKGRVKSTRESEI